MPGVPTPKDRFTSLDTLALVREIRGIARGRVDKAFDLPAGGWALTVRVPREGRRELRLVPGRYAALLAETGPYAEELSPFARELRRLLEGAVLESVPDPGGERLFEIVLRRSDHPEPIRLALEMFGSGNLIVSRGSTIAAAAVKRKWAHRTVAVGAEYARPPGRADPFSVGVAEIEAELARSRTDLASTLGARLALGGPLAEEVIARGGWDGAAPAASVAGRVGPELHRVLKTLLLELGERPAGYLYRREGIAVDATPYRSQRWREFTDVEEVAQPTFSRAAAEYFTTLLVAPASEEELDRSRAIEELEHQIDRQRTAVGELERRVEELKADASAVFDHYAEAERTLAEAGLKEPEGPTVEARLGSRTVSLLRGESPRTTAQGLFEEAKRVQAKWNGAVSALAEAEAKRNDLARTPPKPRAAPSAKLVGIPRGRGPWFERFRWFISSEGAVVVGGRDAASNDLVVKRHLKEGDVYVHADLHGAASVVVKHPEPGASPLTETTYREAGQWAVAFSKAWRAGHASASAFWVTPDQVSKSAESGEFVARGAWVVRGTKHLLHDLPTELAIGTIEYAGETRWTAAPPDAVRRRGVVRAIVTPGDERKRSEEEVRLSRELGVPRSLLQSLLPAGGITVRRP
jgi:predicted ribosome quality control (RQC) complex YloA/Tae2 family protein